MRKGLAGVLVLGLVAVSACTGDDEDEADDDRATTTTTIDPAFVESLEVPAMPPFAAASDGGVVQVAEEGYSVFTDSEGQPTLSWGVVVENTSHQVALHTDFRTDIVLASDGSEVVERRVSTVDVLMPGQRFGFGLGDRLDGAEVVDVSVEVGGSQWVPREAAGLAFGDLTASVVAADPADSRDLTMAVDSTYSAEVDPIATAVFRDASGGIVGGLGRWAAIGPQTVPPGHQDGVMLTIPDYGVPDAANVEVFLDPRLVLPDLAGAVGEDAAAEDKADPAAFCVLYEEYSHRMWAAHLVPGVDPRTALAPMLAVDPPRSIASAWDAWRNWNWGAATASAARAPVDGLPPEELSGRAPDEAIEDELSDVASYWTDKCGRYELGFQGFSYYDEPDELPPFTSPETGGITLVEQGFSQFPSQYDEPLVSYGLVVENTSDQVATDVVVHVTPAGASGRITEGDPVMVPVLHPGQRLGIGRTDYGDASAMTGLDVSFEANAWWPADGWPSELGEVSAAEVSFNHLSDGTDMVTFALDSTYAVRLLGSPHVVYRDAAGAVVGGAQEQISDDVIPGRSFGSVRVNFPVPDTADASTTQVSFHGG